MVMAYVFLKSQGLEGPVAEVGIDAKKARVAEAVNCSVSELMASRTMLRFTYTAKALPFPRGPYEKVGDLIPFESEFNQELLKVRGLKKGTYELRIDEVAQGDVSAEECAAGINLALLDKAPQMAQANAVLALCQKRAQLAGKIRRIVWAIGHLRTIKDFDADNVEASKAMIARIEAGDAPEGLWGATSDYVKGQLRTYAENVDRYDELILELDQMTGPLYAAAQPLPRTISLSRKK